MTHVDLFKGAEMKGVLTDITAGEPSVSRVLSLPDWCRATGQSETMVVDHVLLLYGLYLSRYLADAVAGLELKVDRLDQKIDSNMGELARRLLEGGGR